jgi:hypothetical protein
LLVQVSIALLFLGSGILDHTLLASMPNISKPNNQKHTNEYDRTWAYSWWPNTDPNTNLFLRIHVLSTAATSLWLDLTSRDTDLPIYRSVHRTRYPPPSSFFLGLDLFRLRFPCSTTFLIPHHLNFHWIFSYWLGLAFALLAWLGILHFACAEMRYRGVGMG